MGNFLTQMLTPSATNPIAQKSGFAPLVVGFVVALGGVRPLAPNLVVAFVAVLQARG